MKPSTAVILAAGTGSRMLPITAAIPKQLLPIVDRPAIDYVVDDIIAAGISRIIIVHSPGEDGFKRYYESNPELEAALKRLGKTAELDRIKAVHQKAKFEFAIQPANAGYGSAVPLRAALPLLAADEAILVADCDTFIPEVPNISTKLIAAAASEDVAGVIAGIEQTPEQLQHFGALKTTGTGASERLDDIVEKPPVGTAPTNLSNMTRYLMGPSVWPYVKNLVPNPTTGELYITDAVTAAAKAHPIAVARIQGTFIDLGSLSGWAAANQLLQRRQSS